MNIYISIQTEYEADPVDYEIEIESCGHEIADYGIYKERQLMNFQLSDEVLEKIEEKVNDWWSKNMLGSSFHE
jgi:hypothetical protein